ncbi:hypothetical protein J4E91_003604 [Alternaria rosae]|nr:hypothetical protein J4E91_003604 [Alternaria rosae]
MATQSLDHHVSTNRTAEPRDTRDQDYREWKTMETIKRKRPTGELREARKKTRMDSTVASRERCPLMEVFHEYGLLEMIISSLYPDDLMALLLCSKTVHKTILPQSSSLENLLGKLKCSGRGVQIRNKRHKKSTFFDAYDCTEYIKCGAKESDTECRPCSRCKVSTCDECRIHCVYQSIYETPCDEDELPNFSGFVLLSPFEIPILSPHHMSSDDSAPEWESSAHGSSAPHHDQGFIDVPFEEDSFGLPECVEELLDKGNDGSATTASQKTGQIAEEDFQTFSVSALCAVDFLTAGYACAVTRQKNLNWIQYSLNTKNIAPVGDRLGTRPACGAGER